MGFLTTSELAAIREDFEATLPDTCQVDYVTRTDNGDGTWTDSWSARGSAIACRQVAVTGRDFPQLTAEQVQEGRFWRFEFSATQAIAVGDRITRGGKEYHVIQTNADQSELLKLHVLAERRE